MHSGATQQLRCARRHARSLSVCGSRWAPYLCKASALRQQLTSCFFHLCQHKCTNLAWRVLLVPRLHPCVAIGGFDNLERRGFPAVGTISMSSKGRGKDSRLSHMADTRERRAKARAKAGGTLSALNQSYLQVCLRFFVVEFTADEALCGNECVCGVGHHLLFPGEVNVAGHTAVNRG